MIPIFLDEKTRAQESKNFTKFFSLECNFA